MLIKYYIIIIINWSNFGTWSFVMVLFVEDTSKKEGGGVFKLRLTSTLKQCGTY